MNKTNDLPSDNKTYIKWDDLKVAQFQQLLSSKQNLLEELKDMVCNNDNIDEILSSFTDILQETTLNVFGKKSSMPGNENRKLHTRNKQKWFNEECHNARKEFNKARNAFTRNKTAINRQAFTHAKSTYNRIKHTHRNKFKSKEKIHLTNLGKTKPREFWKKIKEQYRKNERTAVQLNVLDLYEHFNKLYGTEPITNNTENDDMDNEIYDVELDKEISIEELRHAIYSQNNNKSSGIDNTIAEVCKNSFEVTSCFILTLFNRLFRASEYPKSWGEGIIVPIYKGGDIEDAKNYRGITLINILGKIYSQILLNRLTKWSTENEKIIPNQFGFQKRKSTIDCIFILQSIITKTLSQNKKLFCAFVDFEKCFDKIERMYLWQKLLNENVSTKFVKALQSMYSVVKSCIRYKSNTSAFLSSHIGVKQGDPSSSLLFLFFVNDIISNINDNIEGIFTINEMKMYILLFADDAVLFAQTREALQSMRNDLDTYSGFSF